MTQIIAVANQKGGVGKTTTTRNVGAELAVRGRRVLLIDADHQASLTTLVGCEPTGATLYNLMDRYIETGEVPDLDSAIYHLSTGEDLIPADILLANADIEFSSAIGRDNLLSDLLATIRTRYDYILIDCPPSLGVLSINALVAADAVLIPVPAKFMDARGLAELRKRIAVVRRINKRLRIAGAIIQFYESRLRHQQGKYEEIQAYCAQAGFPFLGSVRKTTGADEAAEAGLPLRELGNGIADDYAALTDALQAQWEEVNAPA